MFSLLSDPPAPAPAPPTMRWICLDGKARFIGPTNRPPKDGCPTCGSKHVCDINLELP